MPDEIEAKVKIADADAFRRRMAARGLADEGTVLEINRLFDTPAGSLGAAGSALRLREERDPADGRVLRTTLTFKGAVVASAVKRRPEVELAVEAAGPMADVLGRLGLVPAFYYEKRRTTWHVGPCAVVLDEVPHLGWFAEVEGPTEAEVLAVLAHVDPGGEPTIRKSYRGLLAAYLTSRGMDPTRAEFQERQTQGRSDAGNGQRQA
jgi:adenylate cyclase class 2